MTSNISESYHLCEPVELRLVYDVTMLSHCTSSQGTLVVLNQLQDIAWIFVSFGSMHLLGKFSSPRKINSNKVFIYKKIPYTL